MVFPLQVESLPSIIRYWFEFLVALDDRYFTLVTDPRFPEGGRAVPKPTLSFAIFLKNPVNLKKRSICGKYAEIWTLF